MADPHRFSADMGLLHPFGISTAVDSLGRGVVIAVAPGADQADGLGVGDLPRADLDSVHLVGTRTVLLQLM